MRLAGSPLAKVAMAPRDPALDASVSTCGIHRTSREDDAAAPAGSETVRRTSARQRVLPATRENALPEDASEPGALVRNDPETPTCSVGIRSRPERPQNSQDGRVQRCHAPSVWRFPRRFQRAHDERCDCESEPASRAGAPAAAACSACPEDRSPPPLAACRLGTPRT